MSRGKCAKCRATAVRGLAACPGCGHDYPPLETPYKRLIVRRLNKGHLPIRCWVQNTGTVVVRNRGGRAQRAIDFGPPTGAADISGIVAPYGWRLEVECKVGAPVTDEQRVFEANMAGAGGVHVIARYDPALTIAENIDRAERLVVEAIEARKRRTV